MPGLAGTVLNPAALGVWPPKAVAPQKQHIRSGMRALSASSHFCNLA